jgi:tetratricopeptide (TPR) repeat protein
MLLSVDRAELAALIPSDFQAAVAMFPVLADVDPRPPAEDGAEASGDEVAQRRRAHDALHALLCNVARTRRLLVALDDVQWGDIDGARLLESLVAEPGAALLFVLCVRREDAHESAFLQYLQRPGGVAKRSEFRTLEVERLGYETAVEMAERLLPTHDRALAEQIACTAEGEPFLIEQLALGAVESAALGLRDVVMARASKLGLDAMRMLELVAVSLQPIPERLAASCLQLPNTRPLCAQLVALSLLRSGQGDRGATVFPYHDRLREALEGALDGDTRARLHFELASVGEAEGLLPPHALAEHFARAGFAARAAAHALEAGMVAARSLAFDLAADMFARTVELAGPQGEVAPKARAERARCLHLAGRCAEAGEAYMQACLDVSGDARNLLTSRAVEAWLACGRIDRVFDVLGPLLAAAGSSYPVRTPAVIAGLLLGIARTKLSLARRPATRALPNASEALRSDLLWAAGKGLLAVVPAQGAILALRSAFPALASGDAHRIGRSLAFIGSGFVPLLGREATRAIEWARELAATHQDAHLEVMVQVALAARCLLQGEWEPGVRAAKAVLELAPKVVATTAWEQAMAHTLLVSAYEYQGELLEMGRACLACLRDVRARGDQITAVTVVSAHGYCRAAQHDAAGLEELIEDMSSAMHGWRLGAGLWDFYGLRLRVLRKLLWGEPDQARRLLDESWPSLEQNGVLRMPIVRGPALTTRLAVLIGQHERDPQSSVLRRELSGQSSQLAGEARPDAAVHVTLAQAALAEHDRQLPRRDRLLALAERAAQRADMRVVSRMIVRLRAGLSGDHALRGQAELELSKLGIAHPEAWARFVTPGWSHAEPTDRRPA